MVSTLNHKFFINKLETDSFVFFYSSFVLKYVDSSNQRDVFSLRFTCSMNILNQIN